MALEQTGEITWGDVAAEMVLAGITRQRLDGEQMTLIRYVYETGTHFPAHSHPEEQVTIVLTGTIAFEVEGTVIEVGPGSTLLIPSQKVHRAWVVGDERVDTINVLSPRRAQQINFVEQAP